MIAEIGGLEALKKEAHRTFVGQLAQRITEAFDRMAGPLRLTSDEREVQQLCRERFSLYDPTCARQVRYVLELEQLRATCSTESTLSRETPPGPPDLSGDDLMAEYFHQDRSERHHRSRSPKSNMEPTQPPRPKPTWRSEWAGYLARWRGGGSGDDAEPHTGFAGRRPGWTQPGAHAVPASGQASGSGPG